MVKVFYLIIPYLHHIGTMNAGMPLVSGNSKQKQFHFSYNMITC